MAVSRRQCSIVAGPHGSIDADKGIGSTTLEFKISFVWPITPKTGPIKAEGVVDQLGPPVDTAEGRVTDSKGRLLDLTGQDLLPRILLEPVSSRVLGRVSTCGGTSDLLPDF